MDCIMVIPCGQHKFNRVPNPSTITCSFVFSPPLLRPTALSVAFPPSVSTFVNLDTGRVQAQVFHICILGQCVEYGFHCAVIPPFGKSGIHRLPGAIRLRLFPPLCSAAGDLEHPFEHSRSAFRGRPPVLSGGSSAFTCSHCSFVNSYRFMPLFYSYS